MASANKGRARRPQRGNTGSERPKVTETQEMKKEEETKKALGEETQSMQEGKCNRQEKGGGMDKGKFSGMEERVVEEGSKEGQGAGHENWYGGKVLTEERGGPGMGRLVSSWQKEDKGQTSPHRKQERHPEGLL